MASWFSSSTCFWPPPTTTTTTTNRHRLPRLEPPSSRINFTSSLFSNNFTHYNHSRFRVSAVNGGKEKKEVVEETEEEVEVEEDLPGIQEKALDLVEFTGPVSIRRLICLHSQSASNHVHWVRRGHGNHSTTSSSSKSQ